MTKLHLRLRSIKRYSPYSAGFTLTEAAIVLGIAGLVLGAIWVAAAHLVSNQRIYNTQLEITSIVENVRKLHYGRRVVEAGATNGNFISAGVFPSDIIQDATAGTALNLWGGNTIVAPATAAGTANDGFTVTFQDMPQSSCVSLVLRVGGQTLRDAGLVGIGAGALTNTVFPVTLGNAIAMCQAPQGPITFTYKLII